MKLVRPNLSHEEAAKQFVSEFSLCDQDIYFLRELNRYITCNYKAWLRYINKIYRKYKFAQYFCIHEGKIIGMVEIRHNKDRLLISHFGHIGYILGPQYRGKGYAKCMLYLALKITKQIVPGPIILTCDETNIASYKTIERCGGILKAKYKEPGTQIPKRQYIFRRRY